jgi:hypothetical protein
MSITFSKFLGVYCKKKIIGQLRLGNGFVIPIYFDSESLKKGIEIIIKYIKRARKHRALAL